MKRKELFNMKKIVCLLLSLILVLGMLPVAALASTTPALVDDVYQVGTAAELSWIAEQVNQGNNKTLKVKLTADIRLPQDWQGIGTEEHKFAGSFDGDSHKITFDGSQSGLFAYVMGTKQAVVTIKNVTTMGIVKKTPIASNAGYAHFTRCVNQAEVKNEENQRTGRVAGIVGNVLYETFAGVPYTDVRITQCGNEGKIAGLADVGGIVGNTELSTFLDQCYNTGEIKGYQNVGGLVGFMQNQNGGGSITNSYNTGKVTGSGQDDGVAGIIGGMWNSVTISNCYNSGESYYAFAGKRYNHTAKFGDGCYFLGVNSSKCSPDATETLHYQANSYEISTRAIAKSAAEMASSDFVTALGSSFKQSCPTPVLSWQQETPHTGTTTCTNCALGSTAKEVYKVSYQNHTFFTLTGPGTVEEGGSIVIQFALNDGYKRNAIFAVKANGVALTETDPGKFVLNNAQGPQSITVTGVQQRKEKYDIKWNDVGNGYRIEGEHLASENQDYDFHITFEDGFRKHPELFEVKAVEIVNEDLLKQGAVPAVQELSQDEDGSYYIESVNSDYRIVVSGVDTYDTDPVTVNLRISEGYNNFHVSGDPEVLMTDIQLEVPYFDLGLYGLEKYYYNPDCYMTNGVVNGVQQVGNPEIAYNNVTVMHAFIVATELYQMGYRQDEVGKALHRTSKTQFENAFNNLYPEQRKVSWSQDVGSSFMNFWTHGTNLNYYVNYIYPIGAPGWGSTSDQIRLEDGDDLTIHLITGAGSGSRFGVFTVNDLYKEFSQDTIRDEYTVQQGQKVKLTLYWTGTAGDYGTSYELRKNSPIYWINAVDAKSNITLWNPTEFGAEFVPPEDWEEGDVIPAEMYTDNQGTVTIDTAGVEPGIYYLAAPGGFSPTGAMDANDKPSSAEAGAALFKLTVEPFVGMVGDVDGDLLISAKDATMILRAVANKVTVDSGAADVDSDGFVTAKDATMVLRYVAKKIESFPANNK